MSRTFLTSLTILCLLSAIFLMGCKVVVRASPTTIYVPTDYATIQEAIDHANEGDTVFVHNGTYYEHVVVNKSLSLVGENISTTIIDGNGTTGNVVPVIASFANVSDFTIQHSGPSDSGVFLVDTIGSTVQNLAVSDCYYGIRCTGSSHSTIKNCNLSGYGYNYGVWIVESDDNLVSNNTISNAGFGIELYFDVAGNILDNNKVTLCTFGIESFTCHDNTVTRNLVSNCTSGISLRGYNNTITENNVSHCEYGGVDISLSNFTVISGNLLTYNGMGIWVTGGSGGSSDLNTISSNTLISNEHGFDIRYCDNNTFYHNNVINNNVQAYLIDTGNYWNHNGEGNYWSDYNGTDFHSGPYQNETGYDWIGDTPYVVDQNNTDNYPLMHPFVPEMQESEVAYRDLLHRINEMYLELETLNSTCRDLQGQINSLDNTLLTLNQQITNFQGQLNSMNSTLQASINRLQEHYDSLNNQFNSVVNVLYVLATLVIVLIVTTVYLAMRKPKIKP